MAHSIWQHCTPSTRKSWARPGGRCGLGDLAEEFFLLVGFPEAAECHGPRQVREFIKQAEQSVRVNGLSAASAVVQDVARQLEYLCHVLLRFICQAAFGEAPERHLTDRGSIKKPGDLARSGLGAL